MAVQTQSLVAFIHVASVERSIKFYADLGFKTENVSIPDGESAPTWAWLESGAASLMVNLACAPIDASQQAVLFYLYVANIKQAHASLVEVGHAPGEINYPFYMPDGEFRLEDPDGYVLMLAQTESATG
jgi:predicted enzyme related to lactoylglutathione lyase